mmetsp:Transcript_28824/g.112316  ORF Transcript_28824/g.112316 Transcript_28824/m.112316 type:complete len:142 (-) Transcript_28824:453-878(-)
MIGFVGTSGFFGARQVKFDAVCKSKGGLSGVRRTRVRMVAASESLDELWHQLAEKMKESDESASVEEWNTLIKAAADQGDLERGVYFIGLMKKTGRAPTAGSYDILLSVCGKSIGTREKEIAFHLVEQVRNLSTNCVERTT